MFHIVSWGLMLVAGMIEGLEVGLTNECTCKDRKMFFRAKLISKT